MTDDLVEWLRAQLDEDERAAADVAEIGLDTLIPAAIIDRTGATVYFAEDVYKRVVNVLDPARVLREVEAKRRIIDLHTGSHECSTYDEDGDVDNCHWVLDSDHCSTVLLLALPYSDRPGYREEWRP